MNFSQTKLSKEIYGINDFLLKDLVSGKLPPRKIALPSQVRVWFTISVRIRAGGQFSSEAVFLEPWDYIDVHNSLRITFAESSNNVLNAK